MRFVKNFTFIGPNWHSDKPVVDSMCLLDKKEVQAIAENGVAIRDRLLDLLDECGIHQANLSLLKSEFPRHAKKRFAFLYAGTAIALQRHAGHKVEFVSLVVPQEQDWFRTVYEYEEKATALNTWIFALFLLSKVIPESNIRFERIKADANPIGVVAKYLEIFKKRVLPGDTQAIINAAHRSSVPWIKYDLAGSASSKKNSRIRNHGGLLLGQAVHSHTIDGTFCTDLCRPLMPLVENRFLMLEKLDSLGVAVPLKANHTRPCSTLLEATQASIKLGFPVALKPCRRRHGQGVSSKVSSLEDLMLAVEKAQKVDQEFFVERHVRGDIYRMIVANHQVIAVIAQASSENVTERVHDSVLQLGRSVSEQLGVGMLVLTVVTCDVTIPIGQSEGTVVDLDIAPELDGFLPRTSPIVRDAADGFIRWLFPPGTPSRIPIIAVTGSNGKTTTCRMISRITSQAGFNTGLACSDGMYINDERLHSSADKKYARRMHQHQLECGEINLSVMEFYFGRLKQQGHIFDWCNIAVCTNVTEEHLQTGWETVEQIAEIKGSILKTARDGVVLNADDQHWQGMLSKVTAKKICLTSQSYSAAELQGLQLPGTKPGEAGGHAICYCLKETVNGADRVVIYDLDQRTDLLAVSEIPATFEGKASFNIDNALQAIAACYLMKLDFPVIRSAISTFDMSFENTPGRQNLYDALPFKVMMDFAHNTDGIQKIGNFAEQLEVRARKILMFAVSSDRTDYELREIMRAAAGYFDHYLCRSYPNLQPGGRTREDSVEMMQATLLEAGVAADRITVCADPFIAVDLALGMGKPGDFLVLTYGTGEMEEMWGRIQAFNTA
jgi:UDP-N-acetylmuramyl tripeptide synthase